MRTDALFEDAGPADVLVARIADGDRDAFAELYRRCRPDVYRFALHMCGSGTLAEDVVQDVFLAVIEHAARYRADRAGVTPWLLGITRNMVRRLRARRVLLHLPDDHPATDALAYSPDPVAGLTRRAHQAALARAILDLPIRFREAVVLCDLQELSYEHAAATLGCAIGTVRSRLHRGRARLARALSRMKDDVVCQAPAPKRL